MLTTMLEPPGRRFGTSSVVILVLCLAAPVCGVAAEPGVSLGIGLESHVLEVDSPIGIVCDFRNNGKEDAFVPVRTALDAAVLCIQEESVSGKSVGKPVQVRVDWQEAGLERTVVRIRPSQVHSDVLIVARLPHVSPGKVYLLWVKLKVEAADSQAKTPRGKKLIAAQRCWRGGIESQKVRCYVRAPSSKYEKLRGTHSRQRFRFKATRQEVSTHHSRYGVLGLEMRAFCLSQQRGVKDKSLGEVKSSAFYGALIVGLTRDLTSPSLGDDDDDAEKSPAMKARAKALLVAFLREKPHSAYAALARQELKALSG
jgi:hypothetical protein